MITTLRLTKDQQNKDKTTKFLKHNSRKDLPKNKDKKHLVLNKFEISK